MSVSRDDFSIAFRSALLQRGGAQKFSVLSLIFLALIIFFLDVYGAKFTKPFRGFINDVVYRVTFLASTPTRFFPQVSKDFSNYINVKEENEMLRAEIEKYKSLKLNVEFLKDENQNLQKILETEYFNQNLNIDNEKIQFLGFKNKRNLNKLSKKIDIFVNLRNEYNFDNNNNFPSKILHYLKYCKPIISTDQLSYRDELRNLLLIKKRNRSYVELIKKIIKFDNKFLTKKQKQSEKVIREFYNWNKIIKNLLTKISD